MIHVLYENGLPADDSQVISCFFAFFFSKKQHNLNLSLGGALCANNVHVLQAAFLYRLLYVDV